MITTPDITIAVSTRNRGSEILKTIESIMASDYPSFDVIVVDQSDDERTRTAMQGFFGQPGFLYVPSPTRGLGAGRNMGIAACKSELIAMTDDDCEVASDWVREIVDAFKVNANIGVVYGNVIAGPHDRSQGFIPAFCQNEPFLARSISEKNGIEGMGASMGVRRQTWNALKGFDEDFGAGSRFASAEEMDFTVRALLNGYAVYFAPAARVIHHGFRTWATGRTLICGYLYGDGAMFARLLRAGHWSVLTLMWRYASRWAFGGPRVPRFDFGCHLPRMLRLDAFCRGFIAGVRV